MLWCVDKSTLKKRQKPSSFTVLPFQLAVKYTIIPMKNPLDQINENIC